MPGAERDASAKERRTNNKGPNRDMKSICVFCGSRDGRAPAYLEAARALGAAMAASGTTLVYGGGGTGG